MRTVLELVAAGSGKLILNLAGLTFIDSHGLATLVGVWKAVNRRDGRVVLSAIPQEIEALLELTRLHSVFQIYPSDDAAIVDLTLPDEEGVRVDGTHDHRVPRADLTEDSGGVPRQRRPLVGMPEVQAA
jgi:anti-anti-sigma factor